MPSGKHIPQEIREMIVNAVADAIALKTRKYQLKQLIRLSLQKSEFADPCARTCEDFISEAKQLLRETICTDRDEGRKQSIMVYEQIIANPHTKTADRIKAQERLDKILGLEHTGNIQDDADDVARRIRETLAEQESAYGL